jgi:hypothetical protein
VDVASYRLLKAAALAYARLDQALLRVQSAGSGAVGGFFAEALSPRERTDLGVALYDLAYHKSLREKPLFEWEQAWFARRLPRPPARLLIGAAGSGRETVPLLRLGYTIDAFEPSKRLAEAFRTATRGQTRVIGGTYQDFSRAVLEGEPGSMGALVQTGYDAVILGWGSLIHVVDPEEQTRLLLACDRVAPSGPVLASFWMRSENTAGTRHSARAGRVLGRAVARARGLPAQDGPPAEGGWLGCAQLLSRDEIDRLGEVTGRKVLWESDPGAPDHVTFSPRATQ